MTDIKKLPTQKEAFIKIVKIQMLRAVMLFIKEEYLKIPLTRQESEELGGIFVNLIDHIPGGQDKTYWLLAETMKGKTRLDLEPEVDAFIADAWDKQEENGCKYEVMMFATNMPSGIMNGLLAGTQHANLGKLNPMTAKEMGLLHQPPKGNA